jgi:hypothetical protein
VGDILVVSRFSNSITRGLAAVGEPAVAVNLLPGTEVAFENDVEYESRWPLLPNWHVNQRVARFRHVNIDNPNIHHHALEFPAGEIILVTRLCEGQRLSVLQLPAVPRTEREPHEQRHEAAVT